MSSSWSFLRNFSATKYYEAAQSGSLTGSGDHSFGAIFALTDLVAGSKTIFGNSDFATVGSGIQLDATGKIVAGSGTVIHRTGTTEAAADATYGLDPEGDLINAWRASQNTLTVAGTAGAEAGALNPRMLELVHAIVTVDVSGNQTFYVNGRVVAQATDGNVSSVNPFRIGVNVAAGNAATELLLAGCWYDERALTAAQVAQITAASWAAKDIHGGNSYSTLTDLAYIWSVKTGNFDGRTNWASRGRLTSINMVKQGATAIDVAGADADILSIEELPIQTV